MLAVKYWLFWTSGSKSQNKAPTRTDSRKKYLPEVLQIHHSVFGTMTVKLMIMMMMTMALKMIMVKNMMVSAVTGG